MVQHLLIADLAPICLTLALTKHILRPGTRRIHRIERAAGPFGHPAFGVVAYVGGDVDLAHPGDVRGRAEHSFVHVLEHLTLRRRRAPVLVAPALADPLAAAARRPRPGALHGLTKLARRLPRHPARVLAARLLFDFYDDRRHALGAHRRSTTSTSPG